MDKVSDALARLTELSDDELTTLREEIFTEFGNLESQENRTRESVESMTALANAYEAVEQEQNVRTSEASELAQAADEAAKKVKGVPSEETEETEEPKETEEVVEEEEKKKEEDKKKNPENFSELSDSSKDKSSKKTESEDKNNKDSKDDSDKEEDEEEDPAELSNSSQTAGKGRSSKKTETDTNKEENKDSKAKKDEEHKDSKDDSDKEEDEDEEEEKEFSSADAAEKGATPEAEVTETVELSSQDTNTESDDTVADINKFTAPAENAPKESAEVEVRHPVITAAADLPGYSSGQEMPNLRAVAQALLDRRRGMGRTSGGDGEQALVASFSTADFYPEERVLDSSDTEGNREKVQAVVASLQSKSDDDLALVAAGGLYGPVETIYDIPELGEVSDRPVKDALPSFNADRGGLRFMTPPGLDDLDGAVSLWTIEDDIAAAEDGSTLEKPCLRVRAGDEVVVYLAAIPLCLTFGNLGARAWPELVERHIALGMVQHARFAEVRLLTRIGSLSTQVSSTSQLGVARDIFVHVEVAAAGLRSRHRLDPEAPLQIMLPTWFRNALRADLVKQIPGDGQDAAFNLVDATVDRWFAARNVSVTWFIDGEAGQVFGAQADGALNNYPAEVVWYMFPAGTFLFLDGGVLDLGLVRDSTLNATNDYKIFLETFENVAKVGVESLRITTPVAIAGASASTVDTIPGTTVEN